MTWYAIGAATIVFMLAVNLVVFLLRRGDRGQSAAVIRRQVTIDELVTYAAMVFVWVVGFASPYVWPDSQWGRALAQSWALPCMVAWSMLIGILLLVIMKIARSRLGR